MSKENLVIKTTDVKSVSAQQIQSLMNSSRVKKYFEGSKFRILSTGFFDADMKEEGQAECKSNFSDFRQITAYDYT